MSPTYNPIRKSLIRRREEGEFPGFPRVCAIYNSLTVRKLFYQQLDERSLEAIMRDHNFAATIISKEMIKT